ncbi:respiratory nitrate reductase subunit gamma [Saccharopolyspora taberi]|uniref:Respiratory nitrate reductase subunit gamma n=1 Tax=Saccharopolyspora taberi TaxID=60895 RepID=A0ABN3VE99_9PSEU
MSPVDLLLWGALPYVAFAVFVVGSVWRYRHDKFGWTSRSSQLHESRLLRLGSPMFHYGLFMVLGGHVLGLLVPKELTELVGVTDSMYHVLSLVAGGVAGLAVVVGLGILLWRRWNTAAVRKATTPGDRITFVVLALVVLAGMWVTGIDNGINGPYDYRASVSPWVRSILLLQPEPGLMAGAPLSYRMHALLAFALFMLWPFSRLVHAFSAPLHYLFRPYIVYRSRTGDKIGTRAPDRGWERV